MGLIFSQIRIRSESLRVNFWLFWSVDGGCKKSVKENLGLDSFPFIIIMGNVMFNTELEHLEHEAGRASEFQNCLFEARLSCPPDVEPIGVGPYGYKVHSIHYCRVTDAVAGTYVSEHECFETLAELVAAIKAFNLLFAVDGEVWPEPYGPHLEVEPPPEEMDEDEIPF